MGDRVSAKAAIRYARDAEGPPCRSVKMPPRRLSFYLALRWCRHECRARTPSLLRVRWDDHEDLGDALVKADDVDAVAEVVFRFWTHATVEYAYQAGAGSGSVALGAAEVVVRTGSWFRTSRDATRDTAHNMFVTLRKKYDATIVLLSDVEEASFEETATLYATRQGEELGIAQRDYLLRLRVYPSLVCGAGGHWRHHRGAGEALKTTLRFRGRRGQGCPPVAQRKLSRVRRPPRCKGGALRRVEGVLGIRV